MATLNQGILHGRVGNGGEPVAKTPHRGRAALPPRKLGNGAVTTKDVNHVGNGLQLDHGRAISQNVVRSTAVRLADMTPVGWGFRLSLFRKAIGMSQGQIGELLGVGQGSWSNYECGRVALPPMLAVQMSRAWKMPIAWVYEGRIFGMPLELQVKIIKRLEIYKKREKAA